ncbi:MAG: hypothetical protein E7624_08080 [Ruminococcaceae bacterium]|nr:hypothetical protein [Oscillospiraceae bacterium]
MDLKTIYRIAATAVACVIGAGFVSGQEVWQFFGAYGWFGILPIAIAVTLFGTGAAVVLWYAHETDADSMEVLVSPTGHPVAKWGVVAFENILHYAFYVLMAAATGALGVSYGLPNWVGVLFFCVVSTTVSMLGIKGLAKVFGWMVPILTVAVIGVAVYSMTLGADAVPMPEGGQMTTSAMLPHWTIAALVYFCFNFVGSVPILVAAAKGEKTRGMPVGALCAILPLGALALMLFCAVMVHPNSAAENLPMMALARACGPVFEYACAFLMLGGIFSTGFSSQGSINNYMEELGLKNKKLLLLATIALSAIAFVVALLGFKDLIGTVYPVLGYIGILPLTIIFVRAAALFWRKCKQKREKK